MKVSVKVVGASGKISLGKEYAGRHVLVQEVEPGGVDGSYCRSNPGQRTLAASARGGVGLSRARAWAKENLGPATDLSFRAIKKKLQRQVLTLLGVPLQAYRPQN